MDRRLNHYPDTGEEEWARSDRRRDLRFASLGGKGFESGDSGTPADQSGISGIHHRSHLFGSV